MLTFAQRLERAKKAARFRTSDLAIWLERPYHTVRGWLWGQGPSDDLAEEASYRLALLERQIKNNKRLPIPYKLKSGKSKQRKTYLQGVLRAVHKRLPRARTAR